MTAFAILCHGEPERLSSLLKALEGFDVFIHIDKYGKRAEILSGIQKNDLSKVTIIPKAESVRGSWGGYSIVEIQLRLIQEFLSHSFCEGPLVFLSGQDFPTKPLKDFTSYLKTKENFFSIQMLDYSKVESGESVEISRLNRIRKLHFQDFRFFYQCKDREKLRYKLGSIPSAIFRRMKITNPNYRRSRPYFIGSQWVAISRTLCDLLLQNQHSLKSEFRFTFCPDELAFQSFYGRRQPPIELKGSIKSISFDSVIDADFHLIHPTLNHIWNLNEFDSIISVNKFFVRKPSWDLLMKLQAIRVSDSTIE
jgi:hypothetical protein